MNWECIIPGTLFPAYAGVILRLYNPDDREQTFPRLRGGDPLVDGCGFDV